MKRTIISICLAAVLPCLAAQNPHSEPADTTARQDTAFVERNIHIEKEYVPELNPCTRTNIEYSTQEQSIKKADIVYSGYASDVQPKPQFYPLDPLEQKVLNRKSPKKGYAALGFGYPIDWLAQFYYPIVSTNSSFLDIMLDHNGILLGKKQFIDTDFGMLFRQNIGKTDQITARIGYGNNFYSYYGTSALDGATKYKNIDEVAFIPDSLNFHQSIHKVNVGITALSLKDRNGWEYAARLEYGMSHLQYIGLTQHDVDAGVMAGKALGPGKLSLGLALESYYYGKPAQLPAQHLEYDATLEIAPAYDLQWNGLQMKLGLRMFANFNKGGVFAIMPDVTFNYNIGRLMSVYASATGDYTMMSMASALGQCRYYDPLADTRSNSWSPLIANVGVSIKPMAGLMLDIHAKYSYTLDERLFMNEYVYAPDNSRVMSNRFIIEQADCQHIDLGARISYNHKERYTAYAAASWNPYLGKTAGMPWNGPRYTAEIGTRLKPVNNLTVDASFIYGGGYRGGRLNPENTGIIESFKMSDHFDLNIGASYKFNKSIALFARLDNILSLAPALRYQDWYGYDNIGFNCLIGVKFGF